MTQEPVTAARASRLAEAAVASGIADDPVARAHGRFLAPIPIRAPEGGTWGWMVPLAHADRLLGFVQVSGAGLVHRYASFQRHPGDVTSCPDVAAWIDRDVIRQRAEGTARAGEALAEPVLTYDRSPDRLYWAVEAAADGHTRVIAVAGDAVWTP
jgi:hypothetical protein